MYISCFLVVARLIKLEKNHNFHFCTSLFFNSSKILPLAAQPLFYKPYSFESPLNSIMKTPCISYFPPNRWNFSMIHFPHCVTSLQCKAGKFRRTAHAYLFSPFQRNGGLNHVACFF
jgi:hypothetical protein